MVNRLQILICSWIFCWCSSDALWLLKERRYGIQSKGLQCKDDKGSDVDWYVVYKLPKGSQPYESNDGSAYMYVTSETAKDGWTMSSESMENDANLIAKTIKRMYLPNEQEIWLVYNDQLPKRGYSAKRSNYGFGHTKGVLGGNSEGGFWLVHSIPHFPTLNKYDYPKSATRYGQSALCVSLSAKELDKIGVALKFNYPDFVRADISQDLFDKYPTLKDAITGERVKAAPWFYQFNVTTIRQNNLIGFAKDSRFEKDLYERLASVLNTDMYTETWQNEEGPLPSSCSLPRKVMNIKEIAYNSSEVLFSSHKDHSKWAISSSPSTPFVCIGDINRAVPQEKRGGGTLCMFNENLWKSYRNIVQDVDTCEQVQHD